MSGTTVLLPRSMVVLCDYDFVNPSHFLAGSRGSSSPHATSRACVLPDTVISFHLGTGAFPLTSHDARS